MASTTQKPQIDSLNAFIHQRLTNIAGEICQVLQETLTAYQEEINQAKQENVYLRKMLAEITLDKTERQDAQSSQADGFPPEKQNDGQAPTDPEMSVIQVKLELSTTQQDLELPKQSCPPLACSPEPSDKADESQHDVSDGLQSNADRVPVPPKQTNVNQVPQNCSPAQIQVKLEPLTEHEKAESQEQLNNVSSFSSSPVRTAGRPGQPQSFSVNTLNVLVKKGHCSTTTLAVLRKPETWNRTGLSSDISCTPGKSDIQFEPSIKDEPVSQSTTHNMKAPHEYCIMRPRSQSHISCRPHYCDVCKKPFQKEWQLQRHLLKHQAKRPNCCELCGKCYSTPHVLKIHLRTHTGERPYHCKFCEKTFSQIGHLKGHERIHTGEKIYSCSVCGKCFTWLSQAKEHIRSHPGQMARVQRKINQ